MTGSASPGLTWLVRWIRCVSDRSKYAAKPLFLSQFRDRLAVSRSDSAIDDHQGYRADTPSNQALQAIEPWHFHLGDGVESLIETRRVDEDKIGCAAHFDSAIG